MSIEQPNTKLIHGNDQRRAQECLNAIVKVLEQYDCFMEPEITFRGVKIIAKVHVQPKPRDMKANN